MGSPPNPPTGQPQPYQAGEFVPSAPANTVTFRTKDASIPSTLYLQRDDELLVTLATAVTNEVVILGARLLLPDGQIKTVSQPLAITATAYVPQTFPIQLAEGWLLGVSCSATVATSRGQTYARISLSRSGTNAPASGIVQVLCAEYITIAMAIGYPYGGVLPPVSGQGSIRYFNLGAFGAGTDFGFALVVGQRWRPQSIFATLVTSATVANRQPRLQLTQGGAFYWEIAAVANQVAGTTTRYLWTAGGPNATGIDGTVMQSMPSNAVLTGAASLGTSTFGLQAGDVWQAITVIVEEWLDV